MRTSLSKQTRERLASVRVLALYLFGSRATNHASPTSDYDFAVVLEDPEILQDVRKKQQRYLALYDIFTDIIHAKGVEPVVDIIFLQSDVSLELKAHVIQHGLLLLDREPNTRANLEACIMERAADFAPLLREMDAAVLSRV